MIFAWLGKCEKEPKKEREKESEIKKIKRMNERKKKLTKVNEREQKNKWRKELKSERTKA